ncbi:hypothetical protein [Streptomyces olivaceoviridis]|uniref:hypothetical protein n=1 Tax=Streptomyces olivaceoviridis TaxID=1921 RepID=UPI0036B2ADAF
MPGVVKARAARARGAFVRHFFLTLPAELEEAAEPDGCNRWQIPPKVDLPRSKPALTARS